MIQQYPTELYNVLKTGMRLNGEVLLSKGSRRRVSETIVAESTLPVNALFGRFELPNRPDAEG